MPASLPPVECRGPSRRGMLRVGVLGAFVKSGLEHWQRWQLARATKQQSTAVEQVNIAIANVPQASMETETSAGQTLQTVSQMAVLSKDLLRIIQPHMAA